MGKIIQFPPDPDDVTNVIDFPDMIEESDPIESFEFDIEAANDADAIRQAEKIMAAMNIKATRD